MYVVKQTKKNDFRIRRPQKKKKTLHWNTFRICQPYILQNERDTNLQQQNLESSTQIKADTRQIQWMKNPPKYYCVMRS